MRLSANHTLQRQPKLSFVLFRLQRRASDLQGAGVHACLCKSIKKTKENSPLPQWSPCCPAAGALATTYGMACDPPQVGLAPRTTKTTATTTSKASVEVTDDL